ncbi:MAG: sulfite oxidase-like oxidoreductase, partial [Candidatus Eremiobacteraeota bacterium]|nr:sulfite oxidase-like oxidoreductase [Candidatus Eremiobacteraeota bacterium]
RLPPGQYMARDFPVLHVGDVPRFDQATWHFRVWGDVERPLEFDWRQFSALPHTTVKADIHCVTRWSKFDTTWAGVAFRHLLQLAGPTPSARFVITHGANGYTANVPLTVADNADVLLADTYEGKPLEPIHGGPLRMFIPSRYFWKSTKWCTGVEFSREDKPGFWELRGYNNDGDPWKEERYW